MIKQPPKSRATNGSIILSIFLLVLSFGLFVLGILPGSSLSRFFLKLSYDGVFEYMDILMAFVRICCFLLGGFTLIISFPSWRRTFLSICLPYPAQVVELPFPGGKNSFRWFVMILFCIAWTIPILLGLILNPGRLFPFLREDGIYEMLQAILYLVGGIIMISGVFLSIRHATSTKLSSIPWALMGCFMILVGLEEISYGQRIIELEPTEFWKKINLQDEFNLHNIATGFFNRLGAMAMICFGLFLPAIALFSSRVSYLLSRLKANFMAGPLMFCFIMAALYVTPENYNIASIDEQKVICLLACIILLLLIGRTLVFKKHKKSAAVLGTFGFVAFSTLAINLLFAKDWPSGNYSEEVKETFIAFGLFGYSINVFMNGMRCS